MRKQIASLVMIDGTTCVMDVEVGHDGVTCWPAEAETVRIAGGNVLGTEQLPILGSPVDTPTLGEEVLDVLRDRLKQNDKDLDEKRDRIAFLEKQNESLQAQLERMFDTLIDRVTDARK